ncbi:hypothetical protein, partial [Rathayibacter rathayi]|uniref:hypothetical protein n=1 Tax=Rathayibacter rathayi TaxID=33887 RepID=UPI001F3365D6
VSLPDYRIIFSQKLISFGTPIIELLTKPSRRGSPKTSLHDQLFTWSRKRWAAHRAAEEAEVMREALASFASCEVGAQSCFHWP